MANRFIYHNSYASTLSVALSAGGTSATVVSAGALATPAATEQMRLTLVDPNDPSSYEIVDVTTVASLVLTITRSIEGPAASAWPIGTIVSARLTAEMIDAMAAGFDNEGDAKGANAVNLQPSRASSSQVASGLEAVNIGKNTIADGQTSVVIGSGGAGTGRDTVAIGTGMQCISRGQIAINGPSFDVARTADYSALIGSWKYAPTKYARNVGGYEFIQPHDWRYTGSASATQTFANTTQEMVIFSDPVNLGSTPSWIAATGYSHGDVIFPTTPNGKCYLCYEWATDYYGSGTSGATEPTWPTTAGDTVSDNGLTWICVDLNDYEMVMPDYFRFIPTEVGFIAEKVTDTTQPYISFGINGNMTKWLASTQTSDLTADLTMERLTPTNNEGSKQLGADLVTAGTGEYTGRFYWKGLVFEIDTA